MSDNSASRSYLLGVLVQPRWITISEDDVATELISQPAMVSMTNLREYVEALLAAAEAKRHPTIADNEKSGG